MIYDTLLAYSEHVKRTNEVRAPLLRAARAGEADAVLVLWASYRAVIWGPEQIQAAYPNGYDVAQFSTMNYWGELNYEPQDRSIDHFAQ